MTGTTEVITFGCRLNRYESEVVRRQAKAVDMGEAVIINTCAVTEAAVNEACRAIRRVRRRYPAIRIVVTGCAAQIEPERFASMEEVDEVVGNDEKLSAATWAGESNARVRVAEIEKAHALPARKIGRLPGRTRGFVPVQSGCDHRCTFCIIPYGRGPSRSVPTEAVVAEARAAVEAGVPEVALTGVDLTSYGEDLDGTPPLGRLVATILAEIPELPRLRLSSIDAAEVDDELVECFASEERLMPHLHLSLQSADPMVLKRMRRRHVPADAEHLVERIRAARPEMAFGADLIAGFPTETEEMFRNTYSAVRDLGLVHLHIFPYSPRPGTPAARMPQVPMAIRRERARLLREEGERAFRYFAEKRVGSFADVLVEEEGGFGRSEDYLPVVAPGGKPGTIVRRRIESAHGRRLMAAVA